MNEGSPSPRPTSCAVCPESGRPRHSPPARRAPPRRPGPMPNRTNSPLRRSNGRQGRIVERIAADHVGLVAAVAGPQGRCCRCCNAPARRSKTRPGADERDVHAVQAPCRRSMRNPASESHRTLSGPLTRSKTGDHQHTAPFLGCTGTPPGSRPENSPPSFTAVTR